VNGMGVPVSRVVTEHAILVETIRRRWPDEAEAILEVERATPYSLAEIHRYVELRSIFYGATVTQALAQVREWMRTHGWAPLPS